MGLTTVASVPKRNRRVALLTFGILAILIYVFLHLNVPQLREWNNSVQVAVQFLQNEVDAGGGKGNDRTRVKASDWSPNLSQPQQKQSSQTQSSEPESEPLDFDNASDDPSSGSTVSDVEDSPSRAMFTAKIQRIHKSTSTSTTTPTPASPAPPEPQPQHFQVADVFNLYLNARRLVILATHRINDLVLLHMSKLKSALLCAPWWVNPLDIRRFDFLRRTTTFTDYFLEFVAISKYENRTFAVIARVDGRPPHDVQFVNDAFSRARPPFQNFLFGPGGKLADLHRCLTPEKVNGSTLSTRDQSQLEDLCSCDIASVIEARPDSGLDVLPSWPPNSSFLVGEYMNFNDYPSMFNILPANRSLHCGDSIQMLVMVSSAPTHVEHRRAIRDTYGSRANLQRNSADLVFLFGRVRNETLQKALEDEAESYGDLIQANFMDSYHNLTLSHLSMYSYVHSSCSNAVHPVVDASGSYNPPSYIFKADDDFLLNLEAAMRVARANPEAELFGCSYCGTGPIRNRAYMTKYYTPRYMYMGDVYPGYLSGVAYMIRGNVLPRFVAAAQSIPIIHMDDAYITGLVPAALSIYPKNSKFFGYGRVEPENGCELQRMACSYVLNQTDMRVQWEGKQAFETALREMETEIEAAGNSNLTVTAVMVGNCSPTATPEELKLQVVDDEFKKMCRYFT